MFASDVAMTAAAQLTERGVCMGEEGRAANKERVEYFICLTCRPRALEKNRQLLQYVKAKEQTVKKKKKS